MSTPQSIKFLACVLGAIIVTACQDNLGEALEEADRKTSPAVSTTVTSFEMKENITKVLTVTARNPYEYNYPLTFSLPTVPNEDGALFNIGASTGVLAFKTAPDFEKPTDVGEDNVYKITININNTNRRDTLAGLAITVINQPDPENTEPTVTPTSILNLAIDENSTALVTTILATDKEPEQGSLTFTLSGADAAWFNLDETSGQLRFITPPDFEKPFKNSADSTVPDNTYDLTVTVSDTKLAKDEPFTVTVNNVNEPPFFIPTIICIDNKEANICVDENTQSLTTPIALDPERDALTFAVLGGADATAFTFDADTGILSFNAQPNFENPTDAGKDGTYTLSLSAKSGTLTSFEPNFKIHVLDVNDPPVISTADKIDVSENTQWVATIQATDEDVAASLKFLIPPGVQGGADAAKFVLTEDGTLSFVDAPNYESAIDANGDGIYGSS